MEYHFNFNFLTYTKIEPKNIEKNLKNSKQLILGIFSDFYYFRGLVGRLNLQSKLSFGGSKNI